MVSCSARTLKWLVFIFNFLIFICGAVVLGLGIWAVVSKVGVESSINSYMSIAIYILIACGALVMLTAFLGCYAGQAGSKPGVVMYSIFVLAVIALKIVGCVLLFVFYLDTSSTLKESYKTKYPGDARIKDVWDFSQSVGECCGVNKYWDWMDSSYYESQDRFPPSCCVLYANGTALDDMLCGRGATGYIHVEGCDWLMQKFYYAIGATTIAVILIELVAVLLIVCLYQHFT